MHMRSCVTDVSSGYLTCHLLPVPVPSQAGITTTLNSRCSVLAAANSVFGRWDETKGEDNIDFMPTILSRFDMIFIVKDEHNEERDVVRRGLQPGLPGRGRVDTGLGCGPDRQRRPVLGSQGDARGDCGEH